MLKFILLVHIFFIGNLPENGNPNQVISCHYSNVQFVEFCNEIETKTGINIYYKKEWVNNITVNIEKDSINVVSAFNFVLQSTNLRAYVWNKNIVITKDQKLIEDIPQYTKIEDKIIKDTLKEVNREFLKTKSANVITEIAIGNEKNKVNNIKQRVRFKTIDLKSKEDLFGATLYIKELKTGTVSNQKGIMEIFLSPGSYSAEFEFLGYNKKNYKLKVYSSGISTIKMEKSEFELGEINIYADKLIERSPGVEKIRAKVIKQLPTMIGEVDILKVSEMLPGIVSVGEGSSGVNIRGGGSDQNAFYINKIPIFNTSHLFGFSSAFNPDIINDFSIYKGYIPLQFGGRLSSVFDINTRQGNKEHFTAHGGISPIAANIVLEAPIIKDKASFILSGRSSYSDWILSQIKDPDISQSHADFYDISAGFNFHSQKTQYSLFYYKSHDSFSFSDISKYQYANDGLSLSLNHNFTKNIHGVFTIAGSLYRFSTLDNTEMQSAYEQDYYINQNSFTADFTHKLGEKHNLNYGANINYFGLNRGVVSPYGIASDLKEINLGKEKGIENALYFSDIYKVTKWLDINLGFRYSLYTPMGAKTIYTYRENGPKTQNSIIDSLKFGEYEVINWNSFPEIRAALNIKTDKNGAVKLAFNQMHQNLFMLNPTIAIAPNSQWKLADYYLKPAKSNQISLGIFRNFPRWDIESSTEIYYSQSKNSTEFKDGADFHNTALVETSVLQGKQHAYGVELMLKMHGKQLDGWLSYTYSRSLIKISGENDWDKINNGELYPTNYDIPNSFNAVLNYKIKKRIKASAVVTYQTGKPVTFPIASYFVDANSYIDYSKRNAYRIPNYFRVDLSLNIEGNLKRNKFLHSSWVFAIYNLTGRDNAYSVFFLSQKGRFNSYKYSVIGVPIFTATWVFKLGNYESK
ncbi:MAG: carboxypeptidase-like regulatory domain-containing protein [Bacteroidales bacterium]|nr:carboxypeptidase-like regulatory domain-containing protein [Bacteroidales bacterium]